MGKIGQFTVETIFWFFFWLAVWYVARILFIIPTYLIVKLIVAISFPDWAKSVYLIGHHFVLSTSIPLNLEKYPGKVLAVKADFLTYGIGWPLMVALYLASDAKKVFLKILLSTCLLLMPQSLGIVIEFLQAVYIQSNTISSNVFFKEVLIILFQFFIMIAPALAPVLLWLATEKDFVKTITNQFIKIR